MTARLNSINLKIPGKVVINGSYIVLQNEVASVVTVDQFLDVSVTFCKSDKFDLLVDLGVTVQYSYYKDPKEHWISQIIEAAFLYLHVENVNICIIGKFDDGFFLEDGTKLGLGSSSCIIIAVIASLKQVGTLIREVNPKYEIDRSSFAVNSEFDLAYLTHTINNLVSPNASGCDIVASLLGPISFSKCVVQHVIPHKYIVLGSFGKSTSTREMLKLIDTLNWENLKIINRRITKKINQKTNYELYLDEMHKISDFIVPKGQYDILKSTFTKDIFACGISGAGGEDAVWCILDDPEEVRMYWESCFTHVRVCKLLDHGIIMA